MNDQKKTAATEKLFVRPVREMNKRKMKLEPLTQQDGVHYDHSELNDVVKGIYSNIEARADCEQRGGR